MNTSQRMRENEARLSHDQLLKVIRYDPETGDFFNIPLGIKLAGSPRKEWYLKIRVNGTYYSAHRLAWLYMTGRWPANDIDHINLLKNDNRWGNLREATRSDNFANRARYRNNTSGVKGVCRKDGKWFAQISARGRKFHLGYYDDINDAARAYEDAARKHFGEYCRSSVSVQPGQLPPQDTEE
jgi:hypothetical protein